MSARHKHFADLTKRERREREREVLWRRRQERGRMPMTEVEWLASGDAAKMLGGLSYQLLGESVPINCRLSERKLRLFACACRRLAGYDSWPEDGWGGMEEHPERDVRENNLPFGALIPAMDHARLFVGEYVTLADWATLTPALAAGLLRDIVGNPLRPAVMRASDRGGVGGRCIWVEPEHRTVAVMELAQAAYSERCADGTLDNGRLGVLSDCLEKAGCDCGELLAHLRSVVAHYRGTWSLDLLLGKE